MRVTAEGADSAENAEGQMVGGLAWNLPGLTQRVKAKDGTV
jgi:hypothetical protein